jgi:hypothetical protein
MEFLAVLVEPRFFGVVVPVQIHDLGVPVRFLSGNIVSTLKDENPFA